MTEFREDSDRIAGWAERLVPAAAPQRAMMTVDVEDYFQVEAFFDRIDRKDWDRHECRVEGNTERILEMFGSTGAKATFFTLGWVARRYPALIRRIVELGHEVASHGLEHRRCDSLAREELLADLKDSKSLLEDVSGLPVNGYRAPSFSVKRGNLWALETIAEAGYRYSSSIYPIRHDLYGIPEAPRFAFRPFASSSFLEIPVTSFRVGKMNLPCGGGGYFRLLPYWWSAFQLRRVAQREEGPCMFYFHPWEIDPRQPRIPGASLKTRIRHYTNLGVMQPRLKKILGAFSWSRVDAVYPVSP
ncbi:MAG TPA: XrtA system polysaccharide deacetylase [Rhizomicrobium sp.]|jgi:polysaccharide deacetylase family protein (PEP-CTERM system associated)|nr:XrtA system polysaccharide deacetylase [Rhizomicrobium sp.]